MNNTPFSFRRFAFDQSSLASTEELVRLRAYQIYEERGRRDGHDVEDWLESEAEIFGEEAAAADHQQENAKT